MWGTTLSGHFIPSELSGLSDHDRALVGSVAIIASDEATSREEPQETSADTTSAEALVGFECIYCAASPLVIPEQQRNPFTKIFPGSIETIGASLRLFREKHLSVDAARSNQRCLFLPFEIQEVLEKPDQHSDAQPMDLQTCCENVALRLGMMNKVPGSKQGVIMLNMPRMPHLAIQSSGHSDDRETGPPPLPRTFPTRSTIAATGGEMPALPESRSPADALPPAGEDLYSLRSPVNTSATLPAASGPRYMPRSQYSPPPFYPRRPSDAERQYDMSSAASARGASVPGMLPQDRPYGPPEGAYPFREIFTYDGLGWCCPYCAQVPFHQRAVGSFCREMPSPEHVSNHMKVCTGLQRHMPYPPSHHGSYPHHPGHPGANPFLRDTGPPVPSGMMYPNPYSVLEQTGNEDSVVSAEDKLLLTDYFYYLNKQLRVCRFTERDRKARGGKRTNIEVGYGGIQCRHCYSQPTARKFFWSDVDRLANSFSEIPGHIMKCAHCPKDVKAALEELKRRHSEQMTKLPRGWQKVFFRRMWRKIHDHEGEKSEQELETPETVPSQSTVAGDSSTAEAKPASQEISSVTPPSSRGAYPLAIPEDTQWLSDLDCFVRTCLEVFIATEADIDQSKTDEIPRSASEGRVGIRCIYCASSAQGACGDAVSFPFSINGIYESVRDFQKHHFDNCPNIPERDRGKLSKLKTAASLSSVLRRYYTAAAKAICIDMHDTDDGIRAKRPSAAGGDTKITTDGPLPVQQPTASSHPLQINSLSLLEGESPPREETDTGTSPEQNTKDVKRQSPEEPDNKRRRV